MFSAGDFVVAAGFHVQFLHHAVLDEHGITLRARTHPKAAAVQHQTDRLGGKGACREVIAFVLAAKGLDLLKIYRDDIADAKTR